MTTAMRRGLTVALVHLTIVAGLGAKLLVDRATRPRAWARTAPVDPDLPIRGRYVRLRIEAPLVGRETAPPDLTPGSTHWVRVESQAGRLVARETGPREGQLSRLRQREGEIVAVLESPLAFFIPERAADPSIRPPGEELWVEVTLPRAGAPRPIRLGVRKGGTLAPLDAALPAPPAPAPASAVRLAANPLLTVASSPSLGGNVNGPTVIRVPDWVQRPLGRYYMYFANHMGDFIRLAYADTPTGPWTVHEPGVLHVRDTAFSRPQPDPKEALADFYTHVASPEILVDHARRRIVLWVHGWWTDGERWPADLAAAHAWAREKRYGQFTQAAESLDGLRFEVRPAITRTSYLRVFEHAGWLYGLSRLGQLSRARDPLEAFEAGPNPFRGTRYEGRVRHVALVARPGRLNVFFTGIGDAPERVLMSTLDLAGDWRTWRAGEPVEVLAPATTYECADLPIAPSEPGDIDAPARQIRDPFVLDDGGRLLLYYSTCGEQGIAAATLTLR